MKRRFLVISAGLALLPASLALAVSPTASAPSVAVSSSSALSGAPTGFVWRREPNGAFHVGESISYVIKYGVIPAGFASLEIPKMEDVNGRPAYHVVSSARTNKGMDAIYKVRDRNESWVDVESLCSLRFRQSIREGKYRRECETVYHQPEGRFRYWKLRKGNETILEGDVPAFVHDVLSALCFIRTRDLEVGRSYGMDANSAAANWPLVVHVREIETVTVPAGTFECFRLEPVLAGEGVFQSKGKLEVWVTRDARKVPVLLRSRVAVGSFTAEMTSDVPGSVEIPKENF